MKPVLENSPHRLSQDSNIITKLFLIASGSLRTVAKCFLQSPLRSIQYTPMLFKRGQSTREDSYAKKVQTAIMFADACSVFTKFGVTPIAIWRTIVEASERNRFSQSLGHFDLAIFSESSHILNDFILEMERRKYVVTNRTALSVSFRSKHNRLLSLTVETIKLGENFAFVTQENPESSTSRIHTFPKEIFSNKVPKKFLGCFLLFPNDTEKFLEIAYSKDREELLYFNPRYDTENCEFIFEHPASKSPLISCIVPVYNAENTLKIAIGSILAQTLRDFELIIVDDCSTDETSDQIEQLRKLDNRIRVEKLPQRSGPGAARNRGLELSCGEYVSFVDADDRIFRSMFAHLYELIAKFGTPVAQGGTAIENERGPIFYGFSPIEEVDILEGKNLVYRFNRYDVFASISPTVYPKLFKRSYLMENDLRFDSEEGLTLGEDMLFIQKLIHKQARTVCSTRVDYLYCWNELGLTKGPQWQEERISSATKVLVKLCERHLHSGSDINEESTVGLYTHMETIFRDWMPDESDLETAVNFENKQNLLAIVEKICTENSQVLDSVLPRWSQIVNAEKEQLLN